MARSPVSFSDFSEEVFFTCIRNLEGGKEALRLASVSKPWSELLGPGSGVLWKTFGAQEFGNTNLQAPPAPKDHDLSHVDFTGVDRYASLMRAAQSRHALWGQVRTSGFGEREGTPWLFLSRTGEDLFAFGGYESFGGPSNALMVAPLAPLKELLSVSSAGIHSQQTRSAATSNATDASQESAGAGSEGGSSDGPRLDFARVAPRLAPPIPSYGAAVTPLVDDEVPNCEWFDLEHVVQCMRDPTEVASRLDAQTRSKTTVVFVSGGFINGGYRNESPDWSLGLIVPKAAAAAGAGEAPASTASAEEPRSPGFRPLPRRASAGGQDGGRFECLWVKPGPSALGADVNRAMAGDGDADAGDAATPARPNRPTARSNASAVYVPARFADTVKYPKGYVMLFGGNVRSTATNTMDILDLATFTWQALGELPSAPSPRNSHTALLVPDAEEPETKAKVMIFGGCTGSDVPRSGTDLADFATFDPRTMDWRGPSVVPGGGSARRHSVRRGGANQSPIPGRAATAVKVGRSALFFGGGGCYATNELTSVDCQLLSERHALRLSAQSAEDGGGGVADGEAWEAVLRSLPWRNLRPCGEARGPSPRSFHAAVSLAPAGVPVLLVYGGWHPHHGNFGDIWAAKLDAWGAEEEDEVAARGGGVGQRARAADRRFSQTLVALEDASADPEDDRGPWVNVGGRVMPLEMFTEFVRMRFGEEEGNRMLQGLLRNGGEQDEEDEADSDADDGDNSDEEDGTSSS
eukprot:TRINITY_DN19486_c1_g2_i1.p1 TRINITY_DN19486_c1_g2~~TRINITY_DN19486_c1_g2_i1.p1  ORF type:complete len:749 (-),score=145.44 TRINITY_DN19486_c1_g2_i1:99-2345(-)